MRFYVPYIGLVLELPLRGTVSNEDPQHDYDYVYLQVVISDIIHSFSSPLIESLEQTLKII